MTNAKTGGGAATSAGINYQARVAAWYAVGILAEQELAIPGYVLAGTSLELLRCETEQPVDDLIVVTSADKCFYAQIKHSVNLSSSSDSALGSTIHQCVRQLLANRVAKGSQPWERPLDPDGDKLVLITTSDSSKTIRGHVPALLAAVRQLDKSRPVDDAATNNDLKAALNVLKTHVDRAWLQTAAKTPSDAETRAFLSMIHVQILDVDAGKPQEREAHSILKTSVLELPEQADAAWNILVSACMEYASTRTGATRAQLHAKLISQGIAIKAPRSYQVDIDCLKSYSKQILDSLEQLSVINIGDRQVHIPRASTDVLVKACRDNNLLLIGDPGAGKSGAVYSVAINLLAEGYDVIVLAADRNQCKSLGELRDEIGIKSHLKSVLANWPGNRPGCIVIDALDKELGGPGSTPLREIIEFVVRGDSRWKILASVRKFELRYGHDLKDLFIGTPPTEYASSEFMGTCHFDVPTLSPKELEFLGTQSGRFMHLLTTASTRLKDLLAVPFNVRLIADLLGVSASVDKLTAIATQSELLRRYWSVRVVGEDGQGDAREAILRIACERILATLSTSLRRADLAKDPSASPFLHSLLKNRVLIEWRPSGAINVDRRTLIFGHNIICDFAIAQLVLQEKPGVSGWLVERPDLALILRPSIALYFEQLWLDQVTEGRPQFWGSVWQLFGDKNVPVLASLAGPAVAASGIETLGDVIPLLNALQSVDPNVKTVAERTVSHLLMAALALTAPPVEIRTATPWCQIAERLTQRVSPQTPWMLNPIISRMAQNVALLDNQGFESLSIAARQVLQMVNQNQARVDALIPSAIRNVCRTFAFDPRASEAALRPLLEPIHLAKYGHLELMWIAYEIASLIPLAPAFVADIYVSTFSLDERSQDPVTMGNSGILQLSTTPQQSVRSARWSLKEAFHSFLERSPVVATKALVAIVDTYMKRDHLPTSGGYSSFQVTENSSDNMIVQDFSSIWDGCGSYEDDEQLMVGTLQSYIDRISSSTELEDLRRELLNLVINGETYAMLWRRIVQVATNHPDTLGLDLRAFTCSVALLTAYDTAEIMPQFFAAVYPHLSSHERCLCEANIVSLPDRLDPKDRTMLELMRDRLLRCLPANLLATDAARIRRAQIDKSDIIDPQAVPSDANLPYTLTIAMEQDTDNTAVLKSQQDTAIQDCITPVANFAHTHSNSAPSAEASQLVLPNLQDLAAAMDTESQASPQLVANAWGYLAESCEQISRTPLAVLDSDTLDWLLAQLLAASRRPEPIPDDEVDHQFDTHPGWGWPVARIAAARGLVQICRDTRVNRSEALAQIDILRRDPVPAVRYQIAAGLPTLVQVGINDGWRLAVDIANQEPSPGVITGLMNSLQRLVQVDPDRAVELTGLISTRFAGNPNAVALVREEAIVLISAALWQNDARARAILDGYIAAPVHFGDLLVSILAQLRPYLSLGDTNDPEGAKMAARQRAFGLLRLTSHSARTAWAERWDDQICGPINGDATTLAELQRLAEILGTAGETLFFGSGTFEARKLTEGKAPQEKIPTKQRFLADIQPILDELLAVPFSRTLHYLLDMLAYLVEADPKVIFLQIDRTIQQGIKSGYHYEDLAAQQMTRIIQRYLADYSALLLDDAECRLALVRILDTFVRPGWPEMMQLAYNAEGIFR